MAGILEITLSIDKDFYDNIKKLSGHLEDTELFQFIFQVVEYILEGIQRKSIYFEFNRKTQREEIIDFPDLLEQYAMDQMQKYIKNARPEDFTSG